MNRYFILPSTLHPPLFRYPTSFKSAISWTGVWGSRPENRITPRSTQVLNYWWHATLCAIIQQAGRLSRKRSRVAKVTSAPVDLRDINVSNSRADESVCYASGEILSVLRSACPFSVANTAAFRAKEEGSLDYCLLVSRYIRATKLDRLT